MKNGKMKLNRTKIVARVMLVVLLFAGTLNLAGCGEPHVKKGQYYEETNYDWGWKTGFKIVSDTREFPIDDVTLSMYIGLEYGEDDFASRVFGSSENVYYIIYATNSVDEIDYANLLDDNNTYIIKEIPYDNIFNNKEYNYIDILSSYRYYNHCEKIKIPKECIMEGNIQGNSYIGLGMCFAKKHSENSASQYSPPYDLRTVGWWCHINDNGTVSIDFLNKE